MAVPNTEDPNIPLSNPPVSNPPTAPVRPSWETAPPRPAVPARRPAPSRPVDASSPFSAPPPAAPIPTSASQAPAYSQPMDTGVKYDLAGNPIPGTGSASPGSSLAAPSGSALPGPVVYSPGSPSGAWPPAPVSPYGAGYQSVGEGTDRVSRLKWNWGAFLIPFWWSVFNGQKGIAVAIVVINALNRVIPAPYDWGLTIASLGIGIYLGATGHRLAWSSERFGGDYDNFIRTQRAWMIWGFVFFGLGVCALVALVVLVPSVFNSMSTPNYGHHYGSGASNGDGSGAAPTPTN